MFPKNELKQSRDRVRAPRFQSSDSLVVFTKTIGTQNTYVLSSENISRSGMLLKVIKNKRKHIPFQTNTLIEIQIDPDSTQLKKPINCLGRIARMIDSENKRYFGIAIVQIDEGDLETWEESLELLTGESLQLSATG